MEQGITTNLSIHLLGYLSDLSSYSSFHLSIFPSTLVYLSIYVSSRLQFCHQSPRYLSIYHLSKIVYKGMGPLGADKYIIPQEEDLFGVLSRATVYSLYLAYCPGRATVYSLYFAYCPVLPSTVYIWRTFPCYRLQSIFGVLSRAVVFSLYLAYCPVLPSIVYIWRTVPCYRLQSICIMYNFLDYLYIIIYITQFCTSNESQFSVHED